MVVMRLRFLLLVSALLWPLAPACPHAEPRPRGPDSQPLRVTTDGVAYCRQLADRLAAFPAPRPAGESRTVQEAMVLCETGHARLGITQLRRALRHAQPPP